MKSTLLQHDFSDQLLGLYLDLAAPLMAPRSACMVRMRRVSTSRERVQLLVSLRVSFSPIPPICLISHAMSSSTQIAGTAAARSVRQDIRFRGSIKPALPCAPPAHHCRRLAHRKFPFPRQSSAAGRRGQRLSI